MNKILLTNGLLCDKIEAHKKGLQHYAFSVFLFNKNGELLLQKRSKTKYHSGGLWSNTCCSHFNQKKDLKNREQLVKRRVFEELGIKLNNKLNEIFIFTYKANVGSNLIENEVDYVFEGKINDDKCTILINKDEVDEIKFVDLNWLKKDIIDKPEKYTEWLKIILKTGNINFSMDSVYL